MPRLYTYRVKAEFDYPNLILSVAQGGPASAEPPIARILFDHINRPIYIQGG